MTHSVYGESLLFFRPQGPVPLSLFPTQMIFFWPCHSDEYDEYGVMEGQSLNREKAYSGKW
jgi:hypothetical protein